MPFARTARPSSRDALSGKSAFAKHARGFAKRVAALPGFPLLWIACAGAAALMIVTGGFRTGELPLWTRVGFWLLLMGWNTLKWQAWFALTVKKPGDWPRASILGTPLLNLPLPLEIALCGRAFGISMTAGADETWVRAVAISVGIVSVASLITWTVLRRSAPRSVSLLDDGLLARARTAPEALAAIQAEDHYCRVRTRDGASALVHYRFGDALGEVAGLDGAQVHRGAWVAAGAVERAQRDGRRWRLLLADGTEIPVSTTYAAEARARGWLRKG